MSEVTASPAPAASRHEVELRPSLLAAVTLLAFFGQAAAFYAIRQDDPFITYRYGQNLAEGHGLVFNVGERLLGSTAPGHMLLSALVYVIFGRDLTPSMMSVLGCMGWSAQALAAYVLLLPVVGERRAVVTMFALLLGAARSFLWVPFETNLVSAFALWAFVAAQYARWSIAAVLCGFAALMRPDALLVAAVIGGMCVSRERMRAWRAVLAFVAVVGPWLIFATLYYGSPLPQSAVTKFQRTGLADYAQHLFTVVGETVVPYANGAPLQALGWLLSLLGAGVLVRRSTTLALYAVYLALHFAAYLYLRPFLGHDWHLYPLQLGAVLFVLGLLGWSSRPLSPRSLRIGAVVALALLAIGASFRTANTIVAYRDDYWAGGRHRVYERLSAYLNENAASGEAFAAVEVGTLAYYTNMRAFDMAGLVTDTARTTSDSAVRWIVLDLQYAWTAPPWPPSYGASAGGFEAHVFRVPKGKKVSFPPIETLASNKQ